MKSSLTCRVSESMLNLGEIFGISSCHPNFYLRISGLKIGYAHETRCLKF